MSTDNPQAGAGVKLPKKEADLFKNVVKHYELKQYKKAVKAADGILKKFPRHGETIAMKGLTFYYLNKKQQAHELVKEGLMNDMRYVSIILLSFFFSFWYRLTLFVCLFSLLAVPTCAGTYTVFCTGPITITTKPLKPTSRR